MWLAGCYFKAAGGKLICFVRFEGGRPLAAAHAENGGPAEAGECVCGFLQDL